MTDEIYKKVGRGGAGNFYSKQDIENVTKTSTPDLEAQSLPLSQQPTSASTSTSTSTAVPSSQPPKNQHVGRGGAGNYITPSTLSTSGLTQASTSQKDSTLNPAPPYPANAGANGSTRSSVVYKGGRGGVGNYDFVAGENGIGNGKADLGADGDEERERVEIGERVRGAVESGLTKPGKAYDGGGKEREKTRGSVVDI